ncbi:hypothetical protein [Laspinema olomoucense]|uniref:hypothetical protein n=1 Tax=Laspinema olomoucense TaxID=3231600 RepID=UPI0021BA6322|nr:hypothetical protein [Laspinema sp. D3d]MCT7973966.1 hypothetical protein [Laspinema sp. D3d]
MIRSIIDRPWGTSGSSGEAIAYQDRSLSSSPSEPPETMTIFSILSMIPIANLLPNFHSHPMFAIAS